MNIGDSIDRLVSALAKKGYSDNFYNDGNSSLALKDILKSNVSVGLMNIKAETFADIDEMRFEYVLCRFSFVNSGKNGIHVSNLLIEHRKFDTHLIAAIDLKINRQRDIPSKTQLLHRIASQNLKVRKTRYRL